jgi:hypothetical protein
MMNDLRKLCGEEFQEVIVFTIRQLNTGEEDNAFFENIFKSIQEKYPPTLYHLSSDLSRELIKMENNGITEKNMVEDKWVALGHQYKLTEKYQNEN